YKHNVGARHWLTKPDFGPPLAFGAAIGVGGSGEIGCTDIGLICVAAQQVFGARAGCACRCAEDAVERAAAGDAHCSSESILVAVLLAFGNEPRRGIEQRDLRREEIAEEPRDAPGDINPRTTHGGAWQNLDTGDAAGGAVPNGAAAHERKTLGD